MHVRQKVKNLARRKMYQKILNGLQDFFGISRKEARGALVMMVFCGILIWAPFVFRRWLLPFVPTGSPPPEMRVLDSIASLLEQQQAANLKRPGRPAPGDKAGSMPAGKIRMVHFDPNTASEQTLTGVGIPVFLAKRIINFRRKGGHFRNKEDLLKIYDFPPDLHQRLEKYITIAPSPIHAPQKPSVPAGKKSYPRYSQADVHMFDINQCDTTALIRLRGIGSKLALRILKFRDGLGGFHSTDQFTEIYGLDSLALSELGRYTKVMTPVRKLPINTATADELARHPYLRNRKVIQVLINYRHEHGPFRSVEDLKRIKVLDEAAIQKIGPYLSF